MFARRCCCGKSAQASLARGEGRRIASDNELLQFAEDVNRRGIKRLAGRAKPSVNEILVSPEAEIDDIWFYVARESRSIGIASRIVDGIAARFGPFARDPTAGWLHEDLGPRVRRFAADGCLIVYEYREPDVLMILHVIAGGRDLFALDLQ